MVVPGMEEIQTEQQQLEIKTTLLFKEQGPDDDFPPTCVLDGMVYALSLLVKSRNRSCTRRQFAS